MSSEAGGQQLAGDNAESVALSQGDYIKQSLHLLLIEQQCGDECQSVSATDCIVVFCSNFIRYMIA